MGILDKFRNHGTRPDGGQWDSANPTQDQLAVAKAAANAEYVKQEANRKNFVADAAVAGKLVVSNTQVQNSGEVPVITPDMASPSFKKEV